MFGRFAIIFLLLIPLSSWCQKLESSLSNGEIFKIAVSQSGIHKIDYTLLNELKINVEKINPKNIKIFGGRGGMLSESNKAFRPDDVQELAIQIEGENDGVFDKEDYILFYAEGPNLLTYREISKDYTIDKNIYDQQNYYFIKIDNTQGKRISLANAIATEPELVLDSYDEIERHENDFLNLLGSYPSTEGTGQEWYGEQFKIDRKLDLTNKFNLNFANKTKPVDVDFKFAGRSASSSVVSLTVTNKAVSRNISAANIDYQEGTYAYKAVIKESVTNLGTENSVIITYPKIAVESEGWLDYLQLTYSKKLLFDGKSFGFRSREGIDKSTIAFTVNNPDMPIWDVSNPFDVSQLPVINDRIVFNPNGTVKQFYSYKNVADLQKPSIIGKISNQNIHRLLTEDIVIVYATPFKSEAERLSKHREKISKLEVATVDVNEVYNEFSSGRVDPSAIRDMAKMLFNRNPSFRYLVLFGDGTYDYKGLVRDLNKENFIPVYETKESLHPIDGFPSDDFYALLDADEGVDLVGRMDIAVGRLPAKSVDEAKVLVDKIIHYETSPSTFGDWRLRTGYNADDEDGNTHVRDMDDIANNDEIRHPLFNQQKVYFDAYEQTSTSGENRFPDANRAIIENLFKGQLSITYLGHGGPLGWAQERVLTVPDIVSLNNYDAMPLMITATCSFAAYDDPSILTPAEQAILNPNGGAIALFSTTRAVYTNSNKDLTNAVNELLYKKVNGEAPTIGSVLALGKNKYSETSSSFRINSRKFTLLGDPSMKIGLPEFQIITEKVNGKDVSSIDTVNALEKVTLEGFIADENGNILQDFNGDLFTTVFDKKSKLQTLQNDSESNKFEYTAYRNIIFKGSASIKNGKWSISFWTPKTINYSFGNSRISYYATDHISKDAAGVYNKLIIGGSSPSVISDNLGPKIDIFMNNRSFSNGGETDINPTLLLDLSDDLGINVTGNAIGQDITAILDNDQKNIYVLNDFYKAKKDDFTSGSVSFPLKNLSLGPHQIAAKAWDISGNSTESVIDFVVVENLESIISKVLVYPNPFQNMTNISFIGNEGNYDIEMPIFDLNGRLIANIQRNATISQEGTKIELIEGTESMPILSVGMYIMKIIVKSKDGKIVSKSGYVKLLKV